MLDVLLSQPEANPGSKGVIKVSDRVDKPIKSVMKSCFMANRSTLDTMVISFLITGKVTVAISIRKR